MYRLTLSFLAAALLAGAAPSDAQAVNSAELALVRTDDYLFPESTFSADLTLELDVSGVTGVSVTAPGGTFALEEDSSGSGEWFTEEDLTFADLAELQAAANGTWTISISGSSPSTSSTSTFSLNADALVSDNFFPIPMDLSPSNGTANVSTDPTLSWSDPTGFVTPYALAVDLDSDQFSDEALSIPDLGLADIAIDATSWQPTGPLPSGPIEFSVFYADANLPVLQAIGKLKVTSGSIVWGDSGFAPPLYPSGTPLLILGSEAIVQFTVPEPSAASTAMAALGVLLVLSRRRATGVAPLSSQGAPSAFTDGDL